ncbi:MAG: hypothetical protein K8T91_26910 [Planctomycetes bacterium]|nr:hypothetical protein [Planctomycetota bacterium]
MPTLNTNIPRFYCYLRKEFLYDGQLHGGEFVKVCVFGASSIQGRALGFHALTEDGATFWRLPIHALCQRADAPAMPLDRLQIWDCMSYEVSAIVFERLFEARVRVRLPEGEWYPGGYMFTLDWHGNEDAQDAGDGGHKCAHIIALDNGNYAALPNNCIQWYDPCFVTPFKDKPDYRTNTRIWKVEREGVTTEGYYYDFRFSAADRNGKTNDETA